MSINYPETNKKKNIMIQKVNFKDINYRDKFFDSLREDYKEFNEWFIKKQNECNQAFIIQDDGIKAMTAYKEENLNNEKIIKIRIIKSEFPVYFSEFAFKVAITHALENNIHKIYFTHFKKDNDTLIDIALSYGFIVDHINERGEEVFVKNLHYNPKNNLKENYPFSEMTDNTKHLIIPIREPYSHLLLKNIEIPNLFDVVATSKQGNSIQKIYISSSKIKKINSNDRILFYQTLNNQSIVGVGIVTEVKYIKNQNEFKKYENRSAFYSEDITSILSSTFNKELLCIEFLYLPITIDTKLLEEIPIPQSIVEIHRQQFEKMIKNSHNGKILWTLLYPSIQNM